MGVEKCIIALERVGGMSKGSDHPRIWWKLNEFARTETQGTANDECGKRWRSFTVACHSTVRSNAAAAEAGQRDEALSIASQVTVYRCVLCVQLSIE